jgi:hypothetical protein
MSRKWIAALVLIVLLPMPAQAAQICGWLVESNQPDDERMLDLWLQSDVDVNFLYQIGGKGIVTSSGTSNSPSSATYNLEAGKAEKAWGFGSTLDPPGKIDVIVELHQTPADIFSKAPTPLLAKFSFQRNIPASERKPPQTLARKQCATIAAP